MADAPSVAPPVAPHEHNDVNDRLDVHAARLDRIEDAIPALSGAEAGQDAGEPREPGEQANSARLLAEVADRPAAFAARGPVAGTGGAKSFAALTGRGPQ
jgi:hypothetical protein